MHCPQSGGSASPMDTRHHLQCLQVFIPYDLPLLWPTHPRSTTLSICASTFNLSRYRHPSRWYFVPVDVIYTILPDGSVMSDLDSGFKFLSFFHGDLQCHAMNAVEGFVGGRFPTGEGGGVERLPGPHHIERSVAPAFMAESPLWVSILTGQGPSLPEVPRVSPYANAGPSY